MICRIHQRRHVVLVFSLLGDFNYWFNLFTFYVCLDILFLLEPVLVVCVYLRICPFCLNYLIFDTQLFIFCSYNPFISIRSEVIYLLLSFLNLAIWVFFFFLGQPSKKIINFVDLSKNQLLISLILLLVFLFSICLSPL